MAARTASPTPAATCALCAGRGVVVSPAGRRSPCPECLPPTPAPMAAAAMSPDAEAICLTLGVSARLSKLQQFGEVRRIADLAATTVRAVARAEAAERRASGAEKRADDLQSRLDDVGAALTRSQAETTSAWEEAARLDMLLGGAQAQTGLEKVEKHKLRRKLDEAVGQIRNLEGANDRLLAENDRLIEERDAARAEVAQLQAQLAESDRARAELAAQVAPLRAQVVNADARAVAAQASARSAQAAASAAEARCFEALEAARSAQARAAAPRTGPDPLAGVSVVPVDARLGVAEAEIKRLRRDLARAREETQDARRALALAEAKAATPKGGK